MGGSYSGSLGAHLPAGERVPFRKPERIKEVTKGKKFKKRIRARQAETGESFERRSLTG